MSTTSCPHCDHMNSDLDVYCANCGKSLKNLVILMTKADIKLLIITAFGGAFAIGIASLFEKSRAFLWRLSTLPVPVAIAVGVPLALVVPLLLVARNRKHRILKLERELSELQARTEKHELDRKERAALAQASLSVGRARGGFVRNW